MRIFRQVGRARWNWREEAESSGQEKPTEGSDQFSWTPECRKNKVHNEKLFFNTSLETIFQTRKVFVLRWQQERSSRFNLLRNCFYGLKRWHSREMETCELVTLSWQSNHRKMFSSCRKKREWFFDDARVQNDRLCPSFFGEVHKPETALRSSQTRTNEIKASSRIPATKDNQIKRQYQPDKKDQGKRRHWKLYRLVWLSLWRFWEKNILCVFHAPQTRTRRDSSTSSIGNDTITDDWHSPCCRSRFGCGLHLHFTCRMSN